MNSDIDPLKHKLMEIEQRRILSVKVEHPEQTTLDGERASSRNRAYWNRRLGTIRAEILRLELGFNEQEWF